MKRNSNKRLFSVAFGLTILAGTAYLTPPVLAEDQAAPPPPPPAAQGEPAPKPETAPQDRPNKRGPLRERAREKIGERMRERRGEGGPENGPPPPGPGLKIADTDGNGIVSKEEFQAFHDKMFARLDANHDGSLDQTEIAAPPRREAGGRPPRPGEAGPPRPPEAGPRPPHPPEMEADGVTPKAPSPEDRSREARQGPKPYSATPEISQLIFQALDANQNGRIERDEAPPQLVAKFVELDANKDGALSQEDAGLYRKLSERGRKGGKGSLSKLLEFDKNGDGKIEKSEAPPRLAENFERMDKNGDGSLDKSEMGLPGRPGKKGDKKPPRPDGAKGKEPPKADAKPS